VRTRRNASHHVKDRSAPTSYHRLFLKLIHSAELEMKLLHMKTRR